MKSQKKAQTVQEIIRPLKTREMFSVSLVKGKTTKIYLGDFETVQHAHQEFQATVELMKKDNKVPYVIKVDNRFDNFTFQLNATLMGHNKTGYKGIVQTRNGKFRARIMVKGKKINLGVFDIPKEAYEAYMKAKEKMPIKLYVSNSFPFINKFIK
jgi:hypothetical protein